uniref:cDNA FLJ43999 fis, clone TESTI4021491 n=1 Tax=Homo sapiens TaxID=9606 RepID=Q6ZU49_HUMAN|nr:unnamed protein product [Homo sapiens]
MSSRSLHSQQWTWRMGSARPTLTGSAHPTLRGSARPTLTGSAHPTLTGSAHPHSWPCPAPGAIGVALIQPLFLSGPFPHVALHTHPHSGPSATEQNHATPFTRPPRRGEGLPAECLALHQHLLSSPTTPAPASSRPRSSSSSEPHL